MPAHLSCGGPVLTLVEAAKFTGSRTAATTVGVVVSAAIAVYAARSFRSVFGGRWVVTLAKVAAVGLVYLLASVPAFFIVLLWAAMV